MGSRLVRRFGTGMAIGVVAATAMSGTAAANTVVDAGGLKARVGTDPWSFELVDRRGKRVLSQTAGTGSGEVGTLGFRTAEGWFRATRILKSQERGESYEAVLETTDPAGRRLEMVLRKDGGGTVELDSRVMGPRLGEVTASGISFDADERERYLGFGERSNAVDQRGNVVEDYVSDGPYQAKHYGIPEAVTPPWGFRPREDATYFPIPWLVSTEGYGVLVDSPETSYYKLDESGTWSIELVAAPPGEDAPANAPPPTDFELRFFAGPTPKDVVRRFTKRTGRQPPAPAPWVFGPWVQPTGGVDEQLEILAGLQADDAPLSLAQTYRHYLPCGAQVGRRAEERERVDSVHGLGLAITTYFNPMICVDYADEYGLAKQLNGLDLDPADDPYVYTYLTSSAFEVSQYDFDQRGGLDAYNSVMAQALADGHDGWMEDFGEYTPLDSHSVAGTPGVQLHNVYPRQYHCGVYRLIEEANRPIARFQRSGWTGVAPCTQIVWGGDPSTVWGFDGLGSAVRQALTMGLSGISTWGSDIGGFFALGDDQLTPELLTRWVQFGAVSGVMRTQADGIDIPEKARPQVWDADQIANWRRYAKLRTQLYPYLAAANARYQDNGMPIMRHLALQFPADPKAIGREDEFMFGPDLLAAPVLKPGATERELYLPRGRWAELWRAVRYRAKSGGLKLGEVRLHKGKREYSADAALDELPLMVRAGALIPLLEPNVDTLANRYATPEQVSLAEGKGKVDLLAFPRGRSGGRAFHGDRLLSREKRNRWKLTIRGVTERRWKLDASLATLKHRIRPRCVEIDGETLPRKRWSYSPEAQRLRLEVRAKRTKIVVRSRCG